MSPNHIFLVDEAVSQSREKKIKAYKFGPDTINIQSKKPGNQSTADAVSTVGR